MASAPIPPPDTTGPGPGGGFASPAPAVEDQGAGRLLKMCFDIVGGARMIASQVPATTPEVRQINDLVTKMMAKIKGNQAMPESQAPPV